MNDNRIEDAMSVVRQQYEPSPGDRERIYNSVIAGAIPVATSLVQSSSSSALKLTLLKTVGTAVLLIGIAGGIYAIQNTEEGNSADVPTFSKKKASNGVTHTIPGHAPNDTVSAAVSKSEAPSNILNPNLTATPDSKPASKRLRATSKKESITPTAEKQGPSLAEELRLISAASKSMNSGNIQNAMTLLQTHRTRFANGIMVQERNGLEIIALCKAGKRKQAKRKNAQFQKASPNAPIAIRIEAACPFK